MLANSYLILQPAGPTDIAAAAMTQRQTIPFLWALAASSPSARFVEENGDYYFATAVGEALTMLDRGQAAWNYNTYFRDTLAPSGVLRSWLANYPSETGLYVNITELIDESPSRQADIDAMHSLGERVRSALEKIEAKDFSTFLMELRRLTYPFITVPLTGDRQKDIEILSYEIRDTMSVEAEMALQLVGVDRDKSVLRKATEVIALRKEGTPEFVASPPLTHQNPEKVLTLFTSDFDDARHLFVDDLGCSITRDGTNRIMLDASGSNFMLVRIGER